MVRPVANLWGSPNNSYRSGPLFLFRAYPGRSLYLDMKWLGLGIHYNSNIIKGNLFPIHGTRHDTLRWPNDNRTCSVKEDSKFLYQLPQQQQQQKSFINYLRFHVTTFNGFNDSKTRAQYNMAWEHRNLILESYSKFLYWISSLRLPSHRNCEGKWINRFSIN